MWIWKKLLYIFLEIEEIVLTVNKKQPLHEQIQKKLLQYERNEKELVSNISVQTSGNVV